MLDVFAKGVSKTCLHLSANLNVERLSPVSSISLEIVANRTTRECLFKVL